MSFSTAYAPKNQHSIPQDDNDLSTHANYRDIRTTHVDLDWTIDWKSQLIHGSCTLELEVTAKDGVEHISLDESYLDISAVEVDGQDSKFTLSDRHGVCGRELRIELANMAKAGDQVKVKIQYSTTKDCTTLGWLNPVQTKSGDWPFLYSQSQAIHARSLLPCQDTPAVKATYAAKVKSTLPALMSGIRVSPPSEAKLELGKEIEYVYKQPVAIPSYLIAIASGELAYRECPKQEGKNWKTGIWTEPLMLDAAYEEFNADTPKFVAAAEKFASPYEFGVYDVLFLPNSFPYGGMENSCLTFATPTVLAGDKSAVDLVAHEISHSWFGNGIGCASWSHFWLNEGWTTYLERLLVGDREGEAARRTDLKDGLALLQSEPRFQRLVPSLQQFEDPDDAFSKVPYEKGSNFLLHLERTVGGLDIFLPYLRDYFKTFNHTSITTDQWKEHLFDYFGKQENGSEFQRKLGQVDFDEWIYGSGLDLCVDLQYDQSLAESCEALSQKWDAAREVKETSFTSHDVESFSTQQKVVFLDKLDAQPVFPASLISLLDNTYGFGKNDNAEVRLRFYQIALKSGPEYAEDAAKWVVDKGRMKFCRPIFRLLKQQTPELAQKTFMEHKDFYHPIARKMIAKDLGVDL
ncbi:peptidase family M1-domain-containing protein [Kockovaella imperatae]|uniref:Peptidase family M1-domain-containing protein n=1 Tax=Kockovaella imperatae TaxID=4999 RepID=A0A1Y1UMF7_9TREE|nr:peptidase family M1-domain-containing protein [Kockovaella imperatae]ORX38697.1 peptidase family M1-domain-containing protein [Kockovaella imperatae]